MSLRFQSIVSMLVCLLLAAAAPAFSAAAASAQRAGSCSCVDCACRHCACAEPTAPDRDPAQAPVPARGAPSDDLQSLAGVPVGKLVFAERPIDRPWSSFLSLVPRAGPPLYQRDCAFLI